MTLPHLFTDGSRGHTQRVSPWFPSRGLSTGTGASLPSPGTQGAHYGYTDTLQPALTGDSSPNAAEHPFWSRPGLPGVRGQSSAAGVAGRRRQRHLCRPPPRPAPPGGRYPARHGRRAAVTAAAAAAVNAPAGGSSTVGRRSSVGEGSPSTRQDGRADARRVDERVTAPTSIRAGHACACGGARRWSGGGGG